MTSRRLLVTSALPYANGPIHLGHMVEYLQTDIWVRFQKLRGHRALYICADDTHGTAIMMRARQEVRSEEELIADVSLSHQADFAAFGVEFDHFGSTNSAANKKYCDEIWGALRAKQLIEEKEVSQLFDPKEGVFLADRFVKGTCPKCNTNDQLGDNCENCGETYDAADLKNPVSTLSGAVPEVRSAKHQFVKIESSHHFLNSWTQDGNRLQPGIANHLKGHFLAEPLRDWDVSRPAPYFGFEIPDAPGNYWYVWFDAPIGYIASTSEWCEKNNEKLDDWWRSDDTEIIHFIGKDITYFHTLFWPTMLRAAEFSLPNRVHVHGFLTVNGEKMSKRRGTFVMARTYLDFLDPAYLRYYYAAKLNHKVDDIDLDIEDFVQKVNSDLVGKVVNLASRSARFIKDVGLADAYPEDGGLFKTAADAGTEIAEAYEAADTARAMRLIMACADRANEYVDQKEPWALKKAGDKMAEVRDVCSVALNLYRQLVIYLTPVLPQLAEQSAELLGSPITHWGDAQSPLCGNPVAKFKHLMQRVDMAKCEAMLQAGAEAAAADIGGAPSQSDDDGQALVDEPLEDECTIEQFTAIDLRVARIVEAEAVPKANKLLKLTLSLGGDERKTVFAGIKGAYEPEALVDRLVIAVCNLKPRQMKFGLSEGMVLAAGPGKKDVYLLSPDSGAKPGQRIH